MISATGRPGRLLPWLSPEGKPCYVFGDGTGFISRIADNVEEVQLDMALELLDHAADMLGDDQVTEPQLRFLAARMAEALRDVHRIAESRGDRIPLPEDDDEPEEPDRSEPPQPHD